MTRNANECHAGDVDQTSAAHSQGIELQIARCTNAFTTAYSELHSSSGELSNLIVVQQPEANHEGYSE